MASLGGRRRGPGTLYPASRWAEVADVIFDPELAATGPPRETNEYFDGILPDEMGSRFAMGDGSQPFTAAEFNYWQGQRTHVFLRFGTSQGQPADVQRALSEWCHQNRDRLRHRRLAIKFNFEAMGGRAYASPAFTTGADISEVTRQIDALRSRWVEAQKRYECQPGGDGDEECESNPWECSAVELCLVPMQGGCLTARVQGMDARLAANKLWCPAVTDGTCGAACIERFMASRPARAGGAVTRLACQDVEQTIYSRARRLHEQLELPPQGMATPAHLGQLARTQDVTLEVFELRGTEAGATTFARIARFPHGPADSAPCQLLLHAAHYHLILTPSMVGYAKCATCGRWRSNLAEHAAKCALCPRCGQPCVVGGAHTCARATTVAAGTRRRPGDRQLLALAPLKRQAHPSTALVAYAVFEYDDGHAGPVACALAIGGEQPTQLTGGDALDRALETLHRRCLAARASDVALVMPNAGARDAFHIYERLVASGVPVTFPGRSADGRIKILNWTAGPSSVRLVDLFELTRCAPDDAYAAFGQQQQQQSDDSAPTATASAAAREVARARDAFANYRRVVWDTFGFDCVTTVSVSQLAFRIARSMLPCSIWLPPSAQVDAWIRRGVYGGKCLPTKQFFESAREREASDHLVLLDVVSLYPHVLREGLYPLGEPTRVLGEGDDARARERIVRDANQRGAWPGDVHGKLAILECDLTAPRHIVNPVLPARAQDGRGGLVWDCADLEAQVYDQVLLDEALRRGYRLRAVHRVVAWDADRCGNPFAEYVDRCFALKRAARKGTPAYTVAKLMMNALYGKLIQKPRNSVEALVGNLQEYHAFCDAHSDLLDWHAVSDTDKLFVSARRRNTDVVVKTPSQVGVFVLSYAKAHLNACVDAIGGFFDVDAAPYYSDTDSLLVHCSQLPKLQRFLGEGLGQLSYDVPGRITRYALPYPKVYACEYQRFDGSGDGLHARAKGIAATDAGDLRRFDTYERLLRGCEVVTSREERNRRRLGAKDAIADVSKRTVTVEIGRTAWSKRRRIEGHPRMAQVPLQWAAHRHA